jgi:hypothetical protein
MTAAVVVASVVVAVGLLGCLLWQLLIHLLRQPVKWMGGLL